MESRHLGGGGARRLAEPRGEGRAPARPLTGKAAFQAARSRRAPIENWQHWDWQHFHIGNIPTNHQPRITNHEPRKCAMLPASEKQEEKQVETETDRDTSRHLVRLEEDTVWLTQGQMTELFQRDRTVITRHINNVFAEGELDEKSNVHFLHIPFSDKPIKVYSLNVIISVGYRVKSPRGTQFRIWATDVLREYLLRGYAFSLRLNQLEDRVDRRMSKTEADVAELKDKVDFFVQTQTPPLKGVFYDGQLWDARALVLKLIASAKRSLILIDNWATSEVLDLFAKKREGVKVTIFTSEHYDRKHIPHRQISDADVRAFSKQYPKLSVRYNELFHDRFLIIDDRELYLIGASLKDLGGKCFGFTKMDPREIRRIKKTAFSPTP